MPLIRQGTDGRHEQGTEAAKLVSNVFTPFSAASVVSVIFSRFSPTGTSGIPTPSSSALIGMATLCIIPLLPLIYGAGVGRTDPEISDVHKRGPLYILGLASRAVGAAIFRALDSRIMSLVALAHLYVGTAVFAITIGWKISTHTAEVACPTAALACVFGGWILPPYALSVAIVWARVKLGSQTLRHAAAVMLVAAIVTSSVFIAFRL